MARVRRVLKQYAGRLRAEFRQSLRSSFTFVCGLAEWSAVRLSATCFCRFFPGLSPTPSRDLGFCRTTMRLRKAAAGLWNATCWAETRLQVLCACVGVATKGLTELSGQEQTDLRATAQHTSGVKAACRMSPWRLMTLSFCFVSASVVYSSSKTKMWAEGTSDGQVWGHTSSARPAESVGL